MIACTRAPRAAKRAALLAATAAPYHSRSHTRQIECDPCAAELRKAGGPIRSAVESHSTDAELVVLARLRCGFVAGLVAPLVPEYRVCIQLADDYVGKDAVQLDLDDL